MEPCETYVEKYNAAYATLIELAPTVDSVNDFPSEEEELAFVKAFRELMRLRNILGSFVEFTDEDVVMGGQEFEDYESKYLNLYEKVRSDTQKEKVSILDDVDFELELIERDDVVALMAQKPKLNQRKSVADRVIDRIIGFGETFFSGWGVTFELQFTQDRWAKNSFGLGSQSGPLFNCWRRNQCPGASHPFQS